MVRSALLNLVAALTATVVMLGVVLCFLLWKPAKR